MTDEEIRAHILQTLYLRWSEGQSPAEIDLREFSDEKGIDWNHVCYIERRMVDQRLIRPNTITKVIHSTRGLFECEKLGLVDSELINKNHRLQEDLLLALLAEEERTHEPLSFSESAFIDEQGISEYQLWNTGDVLCDEGFATQQGNFPCELTEAGRQEAERLRKTRSRSVEFEEMQSFIPQERGRAFQAFVARLLAQEGWYSEESQRSPGEELDVIFCRGSQYFLVECRWLQGPVQPKEVRDFLGKLRKRIALVMGCFISMSGFTDNAISEEVRTNMGDRLVLCFGPGDITRWISAEVTFQNLLDDKIQAAYRHRKAIYE